MSTKTKQPNKTAVGYGTIPTRKMKTMEVGQQPYYTVSRLVRKGREKRLSWIEDKETFTSVEQAETYVRMRIGEDEGRFVITENKPLKMLVND